jgi:uncharacterized protein YjiS (DUF1127 family)
VSAVGMTPAPTALPRRPLSLLTLIADWNDERLTRRALRRLSRHELSDMGLEDIDGLFRR